MKDLIERKAAIDALCNGKCKEEGRWCDDGDCLPVRRLKALQSAQPDIIRCKDCINCSIDTIFDNYWCNGNSVAKDHYCGYAKRRKESEE